MRRLLAVTVVVLTAVAGTGVAGASPGRARGHDGRHGRVDAVLDAAASGPFTGTSTFDFSDPSCSFTHQVYDGTYTTAHRHRSGSFHVDGCLALGVGSEATYTGTFTLSVPHGATLSGTVAATVDILGGGGSCTTGFPAAFDLPLTVTSGTRALRHVTGTIDMAGTWCSPQLPDVAGPISGQLTASLTPAVGHGHAAGGA